MTRKSLLLVTVLAIPFINPTGAEAVDECLPFLKSCLMKMNQERDVCLSSLKISPLCVNTPSFDLIRRRTLLSPPLSEGPAFLGPSQPDRTCIDRFDDAWLRALSETPSSIQQHRKLEDEIARCEQEPAVDLYRP